MLTVCRTAVQHQDIYDINYILLQYNNHVSMSCDKLDVCDKLKCYESWFSLSILKRYLPLAYATCQKIDAKKYCSYITNIKTFLFVFRVLFLLHLTTNVSVYMRTFISLWFISYPIYGKIWRYLSVVEQRKFECSSETALFARFRIIV